MLTRILHTSERLCTFFDQVALQLYRPQRQPILNMADALLVCEDDKTFAALQRQFVDAPDASNMADCLRIRPWQADEVRAALRAQQVAWVVTQAEQAGAPQVIYLHRDDSIGEKHKTTRHLEPVDFHHDHNESTKRQPRYKNGFCYLVCTLRIGQCVVTVDLRLSLRAKTVRRINRYRTVEQRIGFRSNNTLARQILETLRPLLPAGWTVYVQFDSWYASATVLKYVRRQRWHVTCGLKGYRLLNGVRVDHLASALRHRRYTRVRVTATDGNTTTYYVRETTGRLSDVPDDVRVWLSKRHPRGKSSAYSLSTDLTRSAHQAWQGSGGRWACEVDNFYLQTRLGRADFRVRSYEAVDKYMVVVPLAWGYIERRLIQERSAQVKCYGDIIRRHQEEHAREWLTGALQRALETGAIEPVLQRCLRETA
jgi:Transposase DDE domain